MRKGRLPLAAALTLFGAACGPSAPAGVEHEGTIVTDGDASSPMVVDLGGSDDEEDLDVVLMSASRLQLDVLTPVGGGGWGRFGSYFVGESPPVQQVRGKVAGRHVIAVQLEDGRVTLLGAAAYKPHRLDFPVRVYAPGDGEESGLSNIALGDVDGDVSDDLVIAHDHGIGVITTLRRALSANPEEPPEMDGWSLDDAFQASAVSAVPTTMEGLPGVIALARESAAARLYTREKDGWKSTDIELPLPGTSILETRCADWSALIVLQDGSMMAVPRGGGTASVPVGDAKVFAAAADADVRAMFTSLTNEVSLSFGCSTGQASVTTSPEGVTGLAVGASRSGSTLVAVLGADGRTVDVFHERRD